LSYTYRNPLQPFEFRDLIDMVEKGEILSPEMIQRGFVWGKTKIYDLFESIFKNYPIGIIILWEMDDELRMKIRSGEDIPIGFKPLIKLDHRPENPKYFVIDGLQRLISFILIKNGEAEVLHKQKEYKKQKVNIYYNPEEDRVGPRKGDVGKPAIPVADVFDEEKLGHYEHPILDKLYKLKYRIMTYKVPVYILSPRYDIIDIANIFNRINSKGTKIVLAQIITAYLAVTLREVALDLWEFIKRLRTRGLQISITTPAKSLSYLLIGTTQVKTMLDKVSKGEINRDHVSNMWRSLKTAYDNTFTILREHLGLTNTRILPSETPLTTFSIILYKIDKEYRIQRDPDFNKALALWFVMATFHGYYTGSTEVKIDKDIKSVEEALKNRKGLQGVIKALIDRLEEVVGPLDRTVDKVENITARDRKGKFLLYALLHMNRAVDWYTGQGLTAYSWDRIHLHHIFPRSMRLSRRQARYLNNIGNLTFIGDETNKRIRNKVPKVYLEELYNYLKEQYRDEETAKRKFNELLKSHFIPTDRRFWRNLSSFAERRKEQIVNFVKEHVIGYLREYVKGT